jgi:hypothetical protein
MVKVVIVAVEAVVLQILVAETVVVEAVEK